MLKTIVKTIVALSATVLLFSCQKTVPYLTVNDKAVSFEAAAGEKTVSFSTNLEVVGATTAAEWVSVRVDVQGESGTLKISVTENAGLDPRSAEITLGNESLSEKITVNQLGAAPFLMLDNTSHESDAAGDTFNVSVTANTSWTATVSEDWIAVSPAEGTASTNVAVTTSPNLLLNAREAAITFKAGSIEKVFTVKQTAGVASRLTDSLALVAVYNAADGASWAKNNWDLTTPIDTWNGVTVNAESGRVTALKITASGVITKEWTLPAEIGNLSELTDLRFNGNKVAGEIPESVFGLAKLQKLYLQNNNVSGTLSDKLGNLSELSELYIDRNTNLGGTLNPICSLKQLKSVNISVTSIGGLIPAELANCEALTNFMAYSNKLEGQIPDIWDKLPNIGVLQLYSNPGITGPIPATIGSLKKATGIQMKECNLTGNIPATFGGLEKCGNLQLNGNKLEGEVPAEVQAHPKWLPTSGWKYETNILPQQDGYVLFVATPAEPMKAQWEFSKTILSTYADTFGGTAGKKDKSAGDGGCFVDSNNTPGGRLTYVSIDKNEIDVDSNFTRIVGSTGHPYVKGAWIGDYWLFTLSNGKTIPAGTNAHIKYITRVSATGPKYWVIEYFDGKDWQPAAEMQTADDVQHNLVMEPDGDTNVTVECTFTTTASAQNIQFRQRVVSMMRADGKSVLTKPNSGTARIAGSEFKEDGTCSSPMFEIL